MIELEEERYPKFKNKLMKTIRIIREKGYMNEYSHLTDDEVFEWWKSKKGIKQWCEENGRMP